METLLETIRASLTSTDPETRRAGSLAAQQLAAAFAGEAVPQGQGEPNQREPSAPERPRLDAPTHSSAAHAAPSAGAGGPGPASLDAPPAAPIDPALIAQVLSSLRSLPPEQLLDLAIARLRAALPAQASASNAPPMLRFQLVPLHGLGPRK